MSGIALVGPLYNIEYCHVAASHLESSREYHAVWRDEVGVGGSVLNVARHLVALGAGVILVAAGGRGFLKREVLRVIPHGITLKLVSYRQAAGRSLGIRLADGGDLAFISSAGANEALTWDVVQQELSVSGISLLLLCGFSKMTGLQRNAEDGIRWFRERGITVAMDPGRLPMPLTTEMRSALRCCTKEVDLLLPNEAELRAISDMDVRWEQAANEVFRLAPRLKIAVTLGEAGAALLSNGERPRLVSCPPAPESCPPLIPRLEGAGDAFTAAFLFSRYIALADEYAALVSGVQYASTFVRDDIDEIGTETL